MRQAGEGAVVDSADPIVGEDQGDDIRKVSEGSRLDIFDEVSCQHDCLKLGQVGELTIPHHPQFIEGKPNISQVLVNIFVQEVCRDSLEFICLQVQILKETFLTNVRLKTRHCHVPSKMNTRITLVMMSKAFVQI